MREFTRTGYAYVFPTKPSAMRYLRFVVDGLKSLALPGIKRIEWTPTADYQMILGTNGSGKSTLMREMSPCPAPVDRYHKGGMKQLELEHEHAIYIVTSTFTGSSPRHSFIKDGEELNKGGTQAIQRELVLKHLKYSEKLHDLLIGHYKERFTKMGKEKRKDLIMRLPRSDYSFAQSFTDKVKVGKRDLEGVLKKAKLRLNEEASRLHAMVDAEGIEDRVKQLQDDLTELLYARNTDSLPMYTAKTKLSEEISALERAGRAVVSVAEQIDLHGRDRDVETLSVRLRALQGEIQVKEGILERQKVEFSEIENVLASMNAAHIDDVSDIDQSIAQLEIKYAQAIQHLSLFPELAQASSPEQIEQATVEILGELLTLFAELPDNSDRRFSREFIGKAQDLRRAANDEIARCEAHVTTLKGRLHAIEHTDGVTCPECSYTWTPGLSPREVPELQEKIGAFQTTIAQCNERIAEADKYLTEVDGYMIQYRRWRGYTHQYPVLRLLWEYIQRQGYDTDHPGEHQDVFHHWAREVSHVVTARRAADEIGVLTALQKSTQGGQILHFKQKLVSLEEEVGTLTAEIRQAKGLLQGVQMQHGLFVSLEQAENAWRYALEGVEAAYERAIDALASDVLNRDITRVQGQLGALQHTHNAKQVLLGVIANTEQMLASYQEEFEALDLLARESKKLVADSLTGFVECFVAQLNSVIHSVWSYDLQILPCGLEGDDLDYKFPYLRGTDTVPVSDIEETSTSIGDIIDFAIRLTVMLYLELEDYPLFIDELGASFDVKHSSEIHAFISRLMESKRYSQVFMISHYVQGWGSYSNAEYLVIDARNITVPEPHNQHAIIT